MSLTEFLLTLILFEMEMVYSKPKLSLMAVLIGWTAFVGGIWGLLNWWEVLTR